MTCIAAIMATVDMFVFKPVASFFLSTRKNKIIWLLLVFGKVEKGYKKEMYVEITDTRIDPHW